MKKTVGIALAIAAVVSAGCAGRAKEVDSHLVACPTKVAIGDVPACGKVWKLHSGEAELEKDGDLEVEVKGLVLNDPSVGQENGTPDGVDGVAAAVVCGGKVAAQTAVVPLSKQGDAKIKTKVTVPSDCAKPVVVLREHLEGGDIGGWLAASSMP